MMRLRLVTFPILTDPRFASTADGLFITQDNFKKLGADDNSILFAKIYSNDAISRFIIYNSIDINYNPKSGDENIIYIHKKHLPSIVLNNNSLDVIIEKIDIQILPLATKVVVKFSEENVKLWSEEEIRFATDNILNNQFVVKKNNRIEVGYSIACSKIEGQITNVFSEEKVSDSKEQLYRIDSSKTEIEFKGLPEVRQKVLNFDKIGGLDSIVKRLREIIQIPLTYPELFEYFNIKPYRGVLLYGPPGNGKTMIAKALTQSLGGRFFKIEGADLMSNQVSIGERELERVFEEATNVQKGVIFIDELDAIANSRNYTSEGYEVRYVTKLLTLMDGMKDRKNNLLVLGATNRIDSIDPALRRPGRFDLDFEIPMPNEEARFDIFSKYCSFDDNTIDENVTEEDIKQLCVKAEGFSGADLAAVYRESAMNAIRRNIQFDENGKIFLKDRIESIRINKSDFDTSFSSFKSHTKRIKECPL